LRAKAEFAVVEIAFVVEEISCIEGSVADEFESAAVDLVRAGLGDDVGEAAAPWPISAGITPLLDCTS
jgi:hypothetical protein